MLLNRIFLSIVLAFFLSVQVQAQSLLNKTVTVEARKQKLSDVLNIISKQGNFYFSYISTILPQDSLVSISAKNKTVRQILDQLFEGEYMYKESGNYIILFKKTSGQSYYQITGVVTDTKTGQRVPNASVYERQQLISTLTNNDGYFRLRLRDKSPTAAISISKELYSDTSLLINTGHDQELSITISPASYQLKTVEVTGHMQVERTWLGKMLLSSRQKVQSLNLGAFLADKPYQASLAPGLGTHGRMSGQVINKFSINLIGGYTAGVDGFELGNVFNIVKGNVQYVQLAGVTNIVGGKTKGVQVAGIHNNVLDSVKGVQVAGVSNVVDGNLAGAQVSGVVGEVGGNMEGVQVNGVIGIVKGNTNGVQVSCIGNSTHKALEGWQVGSVYNYTSQDAKGAQISAISNISHGTMTGLQLGTIFNYARHLKGVQIGLVNIADTSSGYSIGLVNIVKHGYHKLSLYSNDLVNYNVAWKTGYKKFYSILFAGFSPGNKKVFTVGYGIGKEIVFNRHLFLTAEATGQTLFIDGSDSQVYRLQPLLNYRLTRWLSVFAGPSLAFHIYDEKWKTKDGYLSQIPATGYPSFKMGDGATGWLGWQAGINIF
ncbi:carboxypeptidase-like regulatory domain-containing protein [Chitinophaga sp. HK235]|uniref:carboxypeptidase-like regulatory domain-containing protein n=1 Tax=Chitinophaga sp. HK235 TaxID=2952571 RepID=UPI001BAA68BC|nr:carboxypeptidase-like regulatory domain-containing protein [Chitinophaga sp. HK235]